MPTDISLADSLGYLAGGVGSGVAVFAAVQFIEKLYNRALPAGVKFYLALFLSFAVPLAAYGLLVAIGTTAFSWVGLLGEFGVGYGCSQLIHFQAPDTAISGFSKATATPPAKDNAVLDAVAGPDPLVASKAAAIVVPLDDNGQPKP